MKTIDNLETELIEAQMDIEKLEDMTYQALMQYGFEMMTKVLAEACRRRSEDLSGVKNPQPDLIALYEQRAEELDQID